MWLALILTCFFFFCNILVFVFNKEWLFRFYLIYIFHCFKHRGRIFFWLLSFFYLSFYSLCFFQYNKTVNIDRYFISFLTKYFFLVVISWLILSNLKFFWCSSDKNVILLFVWCRLFIFKLRILWASFFVALCLSTFLEYLLGSVLFDSCFAVSLIHYASLSVSHNSS